MLIHRSKCPKIDHEYIDKIDNKRMLLEYLNAMDCPVLKKLEKQIRDDEISII